MIVVEGCDGTGKTTLVNQLKDDLSLMIGQRGTQNRDELYKVTRPDTYTALSLAVGGYYKPYIWDRLGPFSDPIYSKMMGRECAFHSEEMRHCMEVIKALRAPIIVCSIPLDVARENAAMAHQMGGVNDNFDQIHALYERLKDSIREMGHGYVYDYRVPSNYDELKSSLETYLTRRKVREWQ